MTKNILVRRLPQCSLSRLGRRIRRIDKRDNDKIEDEPTEGGGVAVGGEKAKLAKGGRKPEQKEIREENPKNPRSLSTGVSGTWGFSCLFFCCRGRAPACRNLRFHAA